MTSKVGEGLLLGRQTPPVQQYSPNILYAIARASGRESLVVPSLETMYGFDLWHAYEMSWLDASGKPVSRVGRFTIPSSTPNIIESKSFKLYLNSLNGAIIPDDKTAIETITADLSAVAGAQVSLQLLAVDDPSLAGTVLSGNCIDDMEYRTSSALPDAAMLVFDHDRQVDEQFYSHLLRSLCPVTGQPDWAAVWLHYRGSALEPESLLAYLLSYREHQEFHEQCVERIFCDILASGATEFLQIQAFYTRRGGLDINPMRCTDPTKKPLPRLNRQ